MRAGLERRQAGAAGIAQFDRDDIARSLCNSMLEGFMEDKAFIEAQQKLFDADPDTKLLAIAADAPLSHFRWTLNKMIAEEQAQAALAVAA